jgi:hypothetical protein
VPKKKVTVTAAFLITTSSDQMEAIAQDVAAPDTASKFDQQLRVAGAGLSLRRRRPQC